MEKLIQIICRLVVLLCCRVRLNKSVDISGESKVLLCNNLSLLDFFLIRSISSKKVVFVVDEKTFKNCSSKLVFKLFQPLVSSPDGCCDIKKIAASIDKDSMTFCFFIADSNPEVANIENAKSIFSSSIKKFSYLPIYIGGSWAGVGSYYRQKPLYRMGRRIRAEVCLEVGLECESCTDSVELSRSLKELSCRYFSRSKLGIWSLQEMFVSRARRLKSRKCISDTLGKELSFTQTLVASVILSQKIKNYAGDSKYIGVLLPSTVGGVLSNLAISFAGKVPVNLNFLSSNFGIKSAIDQCAIKTIVTSKAFIKKAEDLRKLEGLVFLEDILNTVTKRDKFLALIKAFVFPKCFLIKRSCVDDVATVIFSSGSTGNPKGVVLTHHNILSNIEAAMLYFEVFPEDNLCGVLPFFHSFGFTITLWLPLLTGNSVTYSPNPLDTTQVASAAKKGGATVLFATPTFLLNYSRRISCEDFVKLRFVVTGAEKLRERVLNSFEKKYSLLPKEGYGATELSPVVSINLPAVQKGWVYPCSSSEHGTVGRLLPGICFRIVDPVNFSDVATGKEGLLLLKGPNVMREYLGLKEETREAFIEGYYNTGDIVKIDSEGFLRIYDRISRFSKIGGEMVPHIAIEDVLLDAIDASSQVLAITGIPHASKGDELIVLYTSEAGRVDDLIQAVNNSDLPNIYKPRPDNYFKIDHIPLLGSGKLDLRKLKDKATELKAYFKR